MKYRPEIDGLRAIAVVSVVLFHAGIRFFRGGYVGVDVFFVISGYLITTIILSDHEAGEFTLMGFYERRARRIFPALFFVILCCVPFAWAWMTPSTLASFALSISATSAFCNNIALMFASGYFSPWVEEKLLLHTWSLGVEEQFYVFFPLLLILCLRLGKRGGIAVLTVVGLLSFFLSDYGSRHFVDFNFYSIITRAWELLMGALAAIFLRDHLRSDSHAARFLSVGGLILILYSIFVFDHSTPFPGVFALVPTAGTLCVILFASPRSMATRVLSCRVVVGIGLISYSAYLWHQPLFALARLRMVNEPGAALMTLLCVMTFALAYLTWRFVERPFRHRSKQTQKRFLLAVSALTVVLILTGLVGYLEGGFGGRFRGEAASALAKVEDTASYQGGVVDAIKNAAGLAAKTEAAGKSSGGSTCPPVGASIPPDFSALRLCSFGTSAARPVFVVGDSHAGTLITSLQHRFSEAGISGVSVSNGYCQPIPYLYERGFEGDTTSLDYAAKCSASQQILIQQMKALHAAAIVVSIRWTARMFPVQPFINAFGYDNGEGGVEHDAYRETFALDNGKFVQTAESKIAAVHRFVGEFVETGVPVVLVYPIPETGWNIPRRNFKEIAFGAGRSPVISTSFSRFQERNAFAISTLDSIGGGSTLVRVRPSDRLCNVDVPGRCVAQLGGVPLYSDDNHLDSAGVDHFADEIMSHILQAIIR